MSIMKFRLTAYILLIVSLLVSIRLIRDILKLRSADERLATAENELNKAQIEQMNLKQSLIGQQLLAQFYEMNQAGEHE